jgi:hypothetical protein
MPAAFNADDDIVSRYDLETTWDNRPQTPFNVTEQEFYTNIGVRFLDVLPSYRWRLGFLGGIHWASQQHWTIQYGRNDATVNPGDLIQVNSNNGSLGYSHPGMMLGSNPAARMSYQILNVGASTRNNEPQDDLLLDIEGLTGGTLHSLTLTPLGDGTANTRRYGLHAGEVFDYQISDADLFRFRYQGTTDGTVADAQLNDLMIIVDGVFRLDDTDDPLG